MIHPKRGLFYYRVADRVLRKPRSLIPHSLRLVLELPRRNQNKRATEFREWLESVGGTEEKLPDGSFNDPSLPVNTGANARMVVIEKPEGVAMFSSRESAPEQQLPLQQVERLVQSALSGVKNAPVVRVVASPESIGLTAPANSVPSGVTLTSGDIYVF
jgi:hypothetical protein